MSNIKFDNINLLYLIILFSLLLLIPFIILIIKKKINFHNIASLFIHIIICCLLTLSFAGIKTQTISSDTIVYILADVSCSNDNVLEEMDDYINDFSNKLPENNKLGVVAFGKDAIEFIKPGENIKKSAVIVDVGINRVDGKLYGDVAPNLDVKLQTPVPGGVGLLTRLTLMKSLLEAYKYAISHF